MSAILTAEGQIDVSSIKVMNGTDDVILFDPQIQVELEHLNNATDRIKTLEIELDKARSDFRCLLKESSSKVNSLCKKLGSCVEKSKLCRDSRVHARNWLSETEDTSHLKHQPLLSAHNESEKLVNQLHQELKKSIVKSCLSTRRSLLQLNNLANQHQLQLLPYFEMKAQFNQMFEEQLKKVPPLNESDLKMSNVDDQFHLGKSSEEVLRHWEFQDRFNRCGSYNASSKASNSMTLSYQESYSPENVYLEHLTSEDVFMALPPFLKLTPGLVNCTVSQSHAIKSPNHHSNDVGSSIEGLSSKTSQDSLSYISLLCEDASNGFLHHNEPLTQSNNTVINNDATNEMSEATDELVDIKASDFEYSSSNENTTRVYDDNMSDSLSVSSSDATNSLDDKET